jgi:hypothetical protein
MTALGTGPGEAPGGSAGIVGAVLFGAVSVVLIAVAPYPPDTPRVRPAAAPSFESVPPAAAREKVCDACDRTCDRCREMCGDGAGDWDRILEWLPVAAPERSEEGPGDGGHAAGPEDHAQKVVSLRSAFERKRVFTTCCSSSRLFVAASGITLRTFASTTRWKVRPAAARAFRACSKPMFLRSKLMVVSWNAESKVTFTPAARARAR